MGEPALNLAPAEEATGEAAAQQTTKLVLIEGGKDAAAAEGGGEAAGLLATLGEIAAVASIAAIALVALLWPTDIAPDPPMPQAGPDPPAPDPAPPPVPQQNPEPKQDCPETKKCPPHDWYVADPGKSAEDGMAEQQNKIDDLKKSPSRAGQMRGAQFEKDAIDLNGRKRPIESTGRIYRCRRCGAEQEVDIVFKDGQIAEAKSRNFKGVKSGGDQAGRYTDLQTSLNKQNGTNFKPLGKLDKSRPDVDQSAEKFDSRGFEVEQLDATGAGGE
jgi:hypothetical protein